MTLKEESGSTSQTLFNYKTSRMKYYAIMATACLMSLFAACNNDKKEIANVAQGYLDATGNYLIDEAMPYANQETREKTLTYLRDVLIPMTPKEYMESNTPATIVLGDIAIEEDTAVVKYTKTTPIKKLENEIMVVKEEGKWLVYVPLVLPEGILIDGRNGTVSQVGSREE